MENRIQKNLEKDIERLSQEVERLKGLEQGNYEKKEVVKRSFEKFSDDNLPQNISTDDDNDIKEDIVEKEKEFLPDYLQKTEGNDDVKLAVEELLNLTFQKGLNYTLKQAKKADPFVQDAFHDALTEKLMPLLEEKGII